MAILNILSASESLYHKLLRRYIHLKGRKKGHGHFRQFRTGLTTSHSSQVIPWGQITLNQLRYPLLMKAHTTLGQVLDYHEVLYVGTLANPTLMKYSMWVH